MNSENRARRNTLEIQLTKAQDALQRALDGSEDQQWENLELGYAVAQLARVIDHCIAAVKIINNEVAGEFEGEPEGKRLERQEDEHIADLVKGRIL